MFDIQSDMLEGDMNNLTTTPNGIIISSYIAEHLNPKGRAGIIVPEGVNERLLALRR